MRRILIGMFLTAGLLGCERTSGGGSSPSGSRGMTRQQAQQAVWRLPEVARWSENVRRKSLGRAIPACTVEQGPAEGGGWVLSLWERHQRKQFMWNRFRVDADSGDITVWNPIQGRYMSLAEWRKRMALK